ncbi:MAG: type I restriction endonuclease, partial [Cetobacterium sp.]
MSTLKPITETNNFIVLDRYDKIAGQGVSYQTEAQLEQELLEDLQNIGYEYLPKLMNTKEMLKNIRVQLENLNNVNFLDSEWARFLEEYLDKPSDNYIDKTRKIHDDYIYDFVFDDGHIQNIYLLDKKNMSRNKLQVISQFQQRGTSANRYDVTI